MNTQEQAFLDWWDKRPEVLNHRICFDAGYRAALSSTPIVAETEARIVEWLRSRVYAFRNAAQIQGKRPSALVVGYEAAADAIARLDHVTGEKDRG